MRISRFASFVLATLTIAATAQQNPPATTPQIKVVSQLVVLDTVVTDRKGNIVSNLTKDDFTVYENGVPQTIRNFTAPADLPTVTDRPTKDRNGHDNWGTAPLTMIVVDEMDTPFEELAYARDCVRNYLKKQPAQLIEPTMLLWLNDDGFHPVTTFTRDRDSILVSLAKQPPSLASRLQRGAAAEQISAAFAALQQVALFSRGQPGKKEIIWVGRSFPSVDPIGLDDFQRTLLSKAVRSTVDLLLTSRVSLYVIDPTITGSAINDDVPQEVDTLTPVPATTVVDPFAGTFNINLFVSETGGKYFRGYNDLDRQIGDSAQRGTTYYTLTYVPTTQIQDGSYRQIDIRLRNPNLIVQTKKGYYSEGREPEPQTKLTAKIDQSDLRFDLYEASITGMQYSGLGLHVESCERDPDQLHTTCTISVDTGTLTFASTEDQERTTLMAVLSSIDGRGKLINDTIERLTIAIPEAQSGQIQNGHSKLRLHTIVPPSARSLRVVIRDTSGRIGTADVDTSVVPQLTASSGAIQKARHN
jgi:VWFA-related protein